MTDELSESAPNPPESTTKRQHNYPKQRKSVKEPVPIAPNPAIAAMEAELVPLMSQRMQATTGVRQAQQAANRAQQQLDAAREELAQIEGEVNYRLQVIAQMKGLPFTPANYVRQSSEVGIVAGNRFGDYPAPPSPMYQPVQPFPSYPPPADGVGSVPAPNRGLYPDATERTESAEMIRAHEEREGYGRIR